MNIKRLLVLSLIPFIAGCYYVPSGSMRPPFVPTPTDIIQVADRAGEISVSVDEVIDNRA